MKAADFDKAFSAKDTVTLNAYADRMREELTKQNRNDLKIEILFGTDPLSEYPDFICDPNGFVFKKDDEIVFEIYVPTEKMIEADASNSFTYYSDIGDDVPWGKEVSENDIAEIIKHVTQHIEE